MQVETPAEDSSRLSASTTTLPFSRSIVDTEGPSPSRTAFFASMYLFLSYLGVGMQGAPLAHMFLLRCCDDQDLEPEACQTSSGDAFDRAQAEAAHLAALFSLASGLPGLFTCSFLGMLGDARGRRIVLLCPILGSFLSNLSLAVLPAESQTTALPALAVFIGLLGGQYVSNHATFSALADITRHASPEVRSSAFGMVEGAIWVGMFFGPTVGGMIAEIIGDQPTFYVPAFIAVLNFLVTFFGFPETLEEARRKPIEWRRANPFVALSMYLERRVTILFGIMTLCALAALTGGAATLALYAQVVSPMSTLEIGLLSSTVLGSAFVGLLVIMPLLLKCISLPKMMLISQCNAMMCWLFISMSDQTWQLFAGGSAMLTNACFFPIVRTGFCNVFGELRYGEALAAVGVVEQLASLLGSPIFNSIYAATGHTTFGPIQCPAILCAAGFCLVAVVATLCVRSFPTNPAKEEPDPKSSCVREPPLLDPKEAAV